MNKYVSGIRPSGRLHLGNYLGAIKHWRELQNTSECAFFIADMHGQYSEEDYIKTQESLTNLCIRTYRQSLFRLELLCLQHELSFYANTSRLDNMTQYKEKGGTLALYSYPVLMAADIFFHEATHVPIGDDQRQHLELVRELARKTGRKEPEAVINPVGARIMSLSNPLRKMSKSDNDIDGCVYLDDSKDEINRKLKAAVSSPEGVSNLLEIVKALNGNYEYNGKNAPLKDYVVDLIINELSAKD